MIGYLHSILKETVLPVNSFDLPSDGTWNISNEKLLKLSGMSANNT